MKRGWYITVSGMMGSGKTTLSLKLAHLFGCEHIPEKPKALAYLNDLFANPERWAFDIQVSFLCEKVIALKRLLDLGKNVILDRSISEDIIVFATHFYETGKMDPRSFQTYSSLADFFSNLIPPTALNVFCHASFNVILERLKVRGRNFDLLYPPGHLSDIFKRYSIWRSKIISDPFIAIDSEFVDFRDDLTVTRIANEIKDLLGGGGQIFEHPKLPFFQESIGEDSLPKLFSVETPPFQRIIISDSKKEKKLHFPSAYLAAPFTAAAGKAVRKARSKQLSLLENEEHGIIPDGPYKRTLLKTSRILKSFGYSVLLPHKDINKWGNKELTPETVFLECQKWVEACDVFVGIMGSSPGAHFEFGLALGLEKPCIVIICEEIGSCFLSLGAQDDSNRILKMTCSRICQIPSLLKSTQAKSFLNSHSILGGKNVK